MTNFCRTNTHLLSKQLGVGIAYGIDQSRGRDLLDATMMNAQQPTVPSALLPEILEFSPQLLLDDIINYANEAITNTVDALEGFLFRWASEREQRVKEDWDSTQEVEQGLVAFQTLLESHTDIAFDFFETWSLRNIFAIPADLPVVVPHQEHLDLEYPPERETELMTEIDELRRKIDAVRSQVHH
jgi:kinetochore protein Mis12/MTW1